MPSETNVLNDRYDLTDADFDPNAEYEADMAAERASWQDEDDAAWGDMDADVAYADDWWAQQDGADEFFNGSDW